MPWKVVYYPGNPSPEDYINDLPLNEQSHVDQKLDYMEKNESHLWRFVDHYEDKLWEIISGPHRFLYCLWKGQVVILHAVRKRGRRLKRKQIEIALKRMQDVFENY